MRVPQAAQATVAESKITRYLLTNRRKAGYFLSFGFTVTKWDILRDALLAHVASYDVVEVEQTAYGANYVVEGAPAHQMAEIQLFVRCGSLKQALPFRDSIPLTPKEGGRHDSRVPGCRVYG